VITTKVPSTGAARKNVLEEDQQTSERQREGKRRDRDRETARAPGNVQGEGEDEKGIESISSHQEDASMI